MSARCLFGYVSGDVKKPNDSNQEELAKFLKEDNTALFIISSAFSLEKIKTIQNCDSAKDALDKLDSIYKNKS